MTTNVPALTFTQTGPNVPAASDILAGAQADLNAAFGGNLNQALNTPQGQIASTETAIIQQAYSLLVYLSNQFDPAYASGRFQDALGRVYFMTRLPALPTAVTCTVVGSAGTIIPINAQAIDTAGNIYLNTAAVTIPVGGSTTATFQNQVAGAIACPAGTLNAIYQAIPGWESITNATDGVLGQAVESRAAFETRRQQSAAINSAGNIAAILANVLAVSGVVDAYVTSNDTGAPVTITGQTLLANSVYVCVSGGTAAAIGAAIQKKKMPGCNMTGSSSVVVTDTNPLFTTPFPTYTISYQVPTNLTIYIAVSITNTAAVPSNALALIQAAIINAFAGGDGGQRARIGSTLYASRYFSPVAALGSWANIISLFIGTAASPTGTTVIVPINQIPVISAANITLTLI